MFSISCDLLRQKSLTLELGQQTCARPVGGLARFHWNLLSFPVASARTSPCSAFKRSPVDRRGCGRKRRYRSLTKRALQITLVKKARADMATAIPKRPFLRATISGLPDPECSIGVSFFGKLVSGWTNARMPPSVTSNEGTGLRIKRPHVLTARPSAMVVGTTSNDLYHGRGRPCRRVDRSCVYWNCRSTRHANKAESKCPDCCQNATHGAFLLWL